MIVTPEEILRIQQLAKLEMIDQILTMQDRLVYLDEKKEKHLMNPDKLKDELMKIGNTIKLTHFP